MTDAWLCEQAQMTNKPTIESGIYAMFTRPYTFTATYISPQRAPTTSNLELTRLAKRFANDRRLGDLGRLLLDHSPNGSDPPVFLDGDFARIGKGTWCFVEFFEG